MTKQSQKEIGLTIATLAYSGLLFWWLAASLPGSVYPVLAIALVLACMLWVALVAYTLALVQRPGSAAALIIGLPILLMLVGKFNIGSLVAAVLLALIVSITRVRLNLEVKNRIKYNTIQIFHDGTRYLLLGLLISPAGLLIPSLIDRFEQGRVVIPEQPIQMLLKPIEPTIQNILPGYSDQLSVDELVEAKLREETSNLPAGVNIPPEDLQQLQVGISEQIGQQVVGSDSLPAIVAKIVNENLASITATSPLLSALVVIVAIILISRLFIPVFVWPTLAIIAFLVYVTQQVGLSYILKEDHTVERLRL